MYRQFLFAASRDVQRDSLTVTLAYTGGVDEGFLFAASRDVQRDGDRVGSGWRVEARVSIRCIARRSA